MIGAWERVKRLFGRRGWGRGPKSRQDLRARAAAMQSLMARDGVVSVGIGRDAEGREAVVVGVEGTHEDDHPGGSSDVVAGLPERVADLPVAVERVGRMHAEDAADRDVDPGGSR